MTGENTRTKEIQLIEKGETVLTVGSSEDSWIPRTVGHSAGSPPVLPDGSIPGNETIYRVEFDGRILIVNPSHLFYVVDK